MSRRAVRFVEMEYALPREEGMAALEEVRRTIDASDWRISFPVEVRCGPADRPILSTSHGRDTVYLAFHTPVGVDHRGYFGGIEPILIAHGGRPHWGKLHTRRAEHLAAAYPRWEDFQRARDELDPDRVFGNHYLDRVLDTR